MIDHRVFWQHLFHDNLEFIHASEFEHYAAFLIPMAEAYRLCQIFERGQPSDEWVEDTRNHYFELVEFNERGDCACTDAPHTIGYSQPSPYGRQKNRISSLVSPSMSEIVERNSGLLAEKKTLVVIEGTSGQRNVYITKILACADKLGTPRTDLLILLVDEDWRKHGAGTGINRAYMPESIFTFIVGSFLRSRGYITDLFGNNLLPANMFPDHFALRMPEVQRLLAEFEFIDPPTSGFYPFELEFPLFEGSVPSSRTEIEAATSNESLALEMKSTKSEGRSKGVDQLKTYLCPGYFSQGIVAAPFISPDGGDLTSDDLYDDVGFLSITTEGHITYRESKHDWSKEEKVCETNRTVERVLKEAVLKTLPFHTQVEIVTKLASTGANSFEEFTKQIQSVHCGDLFRRVREALVSHPGPVREAFLRRRAVRKEREEHEPATDKWKWNLENNKWEIICTETTDGV